jgi:monoamine oxidase
MDFDVAIVGAGAAGLAAARRLQGLRRVVVLEARERAGGRGFTLDAGGWPLDLGCGWLHSADRNPLTAVAQQHGLTIDKTPAAWGNEAPGFGMGAAERAAFGRAMAEMEEKVEQAARAPHDCAVASLLDPQGLWTPLLNAFSSYYNGAEFDQVSAKDYAAFEDDDVNWRVTEGLGHTIVSAAQGLDIRFGTPVACIDRSGAGLRLETPAGTVEAAKAIVTVPTDLLVRGRPGFSPDLPALREAAGRLPLGLADKLFLAYDEPEALPADAHVFGRPDRAETGSYYLKPFGRPLIEVYLGGRNARELEGEDEGATALFAIEELVGLLGSDARAKLHPLAASRWAADPWAGGSYSHALPGFFRARAALAAPHDERILIAGEATSPDGFSTAHGAWQEGIRAAEAALAFP